MLPRLTSAILLCCILIGCTIPPSPPSLPSSLPVLHVLNRETSIDHALLVQFTAETGVDIAYHTYRSSEEAYNLLTTSKQGYDLIIVSDELAERLRREQRLAVLNHERITHLNNIDPVFARSSIDPGYRFCVPYLWRIVGLGYRYSAIGREIESLAAAFDLAQIKRMALIDDARVSLGLVLIMLGYSPNTSDPVAIGAARDWLLTVRPYIQHLAANDGQDMLQQDRVDIVVEWSGDLLQVARTDDNLRFAIPQEGSLFTVDSMCIPTGSAQQAAAEQFIDFILDAENGAALANTTRYGIPNQAAWPLLDAELQAQIQHQQILEQRGLLFRLIDVDPAVRELYRAAWIEVRQ